MEIKKWSKDNWEFLCIISIAIAIRFYYFWVTKIQPLWWDEAGYMAVAKSWAGLLSYPLESIRTPIYPWVMSFFFRLGETPEPIMRFVSLFIPSIILLILTYLCIREMYSNKWVAIISVGIMSVLWECLFYSNRFQTDIPALIFELMAIWILFKCYVKKEDLWIIKAKYSLFWVGIFSSISIGFRPGDIMFVVAIIIFILILNWKWLCTSIGTTFMIANAIGILLIMYFYNNIPFLSALVSQYYKANDPISFAVLNSFSGFYLGSIFFYLFLIGCIYLLFNLFLKYDQEDYEINADRFNYILIIVTLCFFIFGLRAQTYEFRWLFVMLPAILAITGNGITQFFEVVCRYNKILISICIVVVLAFGMYSQLTYSDNIIKNKVNSYSEIKEAGLWIKNNSVSSDIIISMSTPQIAYYSERSTYNLQSSKEEFNKFFLDKNPKYILVSIFEQHPTWTNDWLNEHKDILNPVKMINQGSTPILIIYEVKR